MSLNVGFPNAFDQAWGRTGSHLMIHGYCKSVGRYAMTDDGIKELFAMVRESFGGGNRTMQPQLLLPFCMTEANLLRHATSPHAPFCRNFKNGADIFDVNKLPPMIEVREGRYLFNRNGAEAPPLDPNGVSPTRSNLPGRPEASSLLGSRWAL